MEYRAYIFLFFLAFFILLEFYIPRRNRVVSRKERWPGNFILMSVGFLIARLSIGGLPFLIALEYYPKSYGILGWLNIFSSMEWLAIAFTALLLDLMIYVQHVVFHFVPCLWRFHKVHHMDYDLDVSSGLRFHPVEIFLSLIIKIFCIFALGAHPLGVLLFEILLNLGALFNHSNLKVNLKFDSILRLFIVTPDMHRIHHSVIPRETNSNFGFCISIWDRIFATYIKDPEKGQMDLVIGLKEYPKENKFGLWGLLVVPFTKK